jgi:hypothetical protein
MPKNNKPPTQSLSPESQTGKEPKQGEANETGASPSLVPFEPEFHQAKDFVSVYANHVFFAAGTVWDFRITFGQVSGSEGNKLNVENHVTVTMPVAVAKMLALGIEANLQQYHKATGKAVELPGITFASLPSRLAMATPLPEEKPKQK